MKAAMLSSPGKISIVDTADPSVAAGEVLIRPKCAGICGTDVSIYSGHRPVSYPFLLGHEVTGHIAALGSSVTGFSIGQRVIVEPNYPCGTCPLCLAGRGAICAGKNSMGVNVPGCFSEYAVAPARFVWTLPDNISDADATTIEPLAVSMHGLLKSGVRKGDTVAVLGCGVVGQLLIHAAVAEGVRVFALDRIADKLEMARRLGAEVAANRDTAKLWREENVTTVFECAGVPATVELALNDAPRGSRVVLLGLSSSPAAFSPLRLVREGIEIRTSMIYDHPADFRRTIDLVAGGKLHPSVVVTHTFPFGSIDRALELASTGNAGKILIQM